MKKPKKSSYQRMKERYEKRIELLSNDLTILLNEESFEKCAQVRLKYQLIEDLYKFPTFGYYEVSNETINNDLKGWLNQIGLGMDTLPPMPPVITS